MSVEALGPERRSGEEIAWGVEMAVQAISRVRLLLEKEYEKLALEGKTIGASIELAPHIRRRIKELESELNDALAFLKEFDPKLYIEFKG